MENPNATGVNTPVQPAAEPTGDIGQLATGQSVTAPQPAPETQAVPYERFREVNEAKKVAEQEAANLRAQFSLLQQSIPAPVQPQQGPADIFAEAGLGDDDIPTVAHVRRYARAVEQRADQRVAATQQMTARDHFVGSATDYVTLVGTDGPGGQFVPSEHFLKVLTADPNLAMEFGGNRAANARIAYRAARAFKLEEELSTIKGAANQQQVDNKVALRTGPIPASAVGGGGAISPNVRPNPSTPEGKSQLLGTFQKALEGDFDT